MIVSLMAPEVTEPPAPGLPRCRSLFRAITNYSELRVCRVYRIDKTHIFAT